MKQSNSLSSKDENMSSENGAAGLTQDQLLFTENIYASLPISIEVYDADPRGPFPAHRGLFRIETGGYEWCEISSGTKP
jgi:hypothetical protein